MWFDLSNLSSDSHVQELRTIRLWCQSSTLFGLGDAELRTTPVTLMKAAEVILFSHRTATAATPKYDLAGGGSDTDPNLCVYQGQAGGVRGVPRLSKYAVQRRGGRLLLASARGRGSEARNQGVLSVANHDHAPRTNHLNKQKKMLFFEITFPPMNLTWVRHVFSGSTIPSALISCVFQ